MAEPSASRPVSLEIIEDLSAEGRLDEGYLTLQRLRVRHHFEDGHSSAVYSCDVVRRPQADAVVAILWFRDEHDRVQLVLKEGVRPAVWLRRERTDLVEPDPEAPLVLIEAVAGVLETGDLGDEGLRRRAAAETWEEVGMEVEPSCFSLLGAGSFASPGTADERVFFLVAEVSGPPPGDIPAGDGSGMEEGTCARVMALDDAMRACFDGRIPDMKTEVALRRLQVHLDSGGQV